MGCLSQKTLVKRGEAIEKLLSERAWRNGNASEISATIEEIEGETINTPDEWTKANLMAEVYYAAAQVYLATVVNGPFPKGKLMPRPSSLQVANNHSARGRRSGQRSDSSSEKDC